MAPSHPHALSLGTLCTEYGLYVASSGQELFLQFPSFPLSLQAQAAQHPSDNGDGLFPAEPNSLLTVFLLSSEWCTGTDDY